MQENHQENNNFETIISTWRCLSGEQKRDITEQVQPSAFVSMSGDSSTHQQNSKKTDEDSNLVLERPKGPIATAASGALVTVEGLQEKNLETANLEEKQEKTEFVKHDKEENNDGAGDFKEVKDEKNYLQNDSGKMITSNATCDKEKGDLVDSVYLRSPPPHKVRSNTTTNDDEDCGIKCLYYTLQCCDCVLM